MTKLLAYKINVCQYTDRMQPDQNGQDWTGRIG